MPERQEVGEPLQIHIARHRRISQNGFDFRGEDQAFPIAVIVQRLLSQAIARQQQRLLPAIPDGKRKHPVEMAQAVQSPLLVSVQDDFRVAACGEEVPFGLQLRPQIEEVIQFAVVNNAAGAVFVPDRLPAGRQVDNAQARHRQRRAIQYHRACFIRPAMRQRRVHARQ
jgi:hypothetical protein